MRYRYFWAFLPAFLTLSSLLVVPSVAVAQKTTVPSRPAGLGRKPAGRATRKVVAVTVVSTNRGASVLKPDGGNTLLTAFLTADTKYHRSGAQTNQQDLLAGEKVVTRLAFYPDGTILVAEIWDPAIYAELQRLRKEVVTGTVETPLLPGSVSGTLVVKPADEGASVEYRVTDKTYFYRNNSPVSPTAYLQGAEVAIKPRSLPSGGFMASIVAESPAALDIAYRDTLSRWDGSMEKWDAPNFSFLLKRSDGVVRRVIFPKNLTITDESSRNRVSDRRIYGPAEVLGRPVIVRLVRSERPGDEGIRTALSITVASGPASKTAKKKATEKPPTAVGEDFQDYLLSYQIAAEKPYGVKPAGKSNRVEITFDADRSEKMALHSLLALTQQILHPNAEGKIILQGRLLTSSGTFLLKHWYITAPLVKRAKKTPGDVAEFREFLVPGLAREDFQKTDRFDPQEKAFKPALYTGPLKRKR